MSSNKHSGRSLTPWFGGRGPWWANEDGYRRMRDEMERFFGGAPFEDGVSLGAAAFRPDADLVRTDGGYELSVELPGVDQKDITVDVHDGVLTVSGEKKYEHEEKTKESFRAERRYGSFMRRMSLPADADEAKIKASFDKGVLTLTIPASEDKRASGRKIQIEAK